MGKTLGYMITWTIYGTWLQGDKRGYVKNGRIRSPNKSLMQANRNTQLQDAILLTKAQQQLVREAIMAEAKTHAQNIYALAVNATYVHIVAGYTEQAISKMVAYYKKAARLVLRPTGHIGKLWTRGYDKRFCFNRDSLEQRIKYVRHHNNNI